MKDYRDKSIHIDVTFQVDSSKLQGMLSRQNWFESQKIGNGNEVEISDKKKEVSIHELYTIMKILQEQEDRRLFVCREFCLE